MIRISLIAGAALAALALAAQSGAKSFPKLAGDVGPGFTIHLTQNGKTVKSLKPGTYSLTVDDRSDIHNFVVKGPGLKSGAREITGVGFKGKKTTLINFVKGTYTYVCTPHQQIPSMHGSFKVG